MSRLYSNTLMGDSLKIRAVNMLRIRISVRDTEYPSVPVSDIESEGVSNKAIYPYLAALKR